MKLLNFKVLQLLSAAKHNLIEVSDEVIKADEVKLLIHYMNLYVYIEMNTNKLDETEEKAVGIN